MTAASAALPIFSGGRLVGSGVLIGPRLVVTCRHVVDRHAPNGSWQSALPAEGIVVGGAPGLAIRRSLPEGAPPVADAHDDLALIRLAHDIPIAPVPIVVGPVAASLYGSSKLVGYRSDPGTPGYRRLELSLPVQATGLVDTSSVDFGSALVHQGMSGGPLLVEARGELSCLGIARLGGLGRAVSVAMTGSGILDFVASLEQEWREGLRFRPLLREELEAYLSQVEADATRLSALYPAAQHEPFKFEKIRQRVRVLERTIFEQWRAEQAERERQRAAGRPAPLNDGRYDPWRSRPESSDGEQSGKTESLPKLDAFTWDERTDSAALRQVIILGDPGFGKSWLLRHEALRQSESVRVRLAELEPLATPHDLPYPVFARLSDLARFTATTFLERLRSNFEEQLLDATLTEQLLAQAKRGSIVLLLDAWDEAEGDTTRLRTQIATFAKATRSRIMLTSRAASYGASPIPGAPELELLAFERSEIEQFARARFPESEQCSAFLALLDEHKSIHGLARIPLLLALLCRLFEAAVRAPDAQVPNSPKLPERRGALYRACIWGLLRDWKEVDQKRRAQGDDMLAGRIAQVARAAETLFPRDQFTLAELAESAGFKLDDDPGRRAAQTFADELKDDGLLVPTGQRSDGTWRFLHRTIHEWLAAHAIARRATTQGGGSLAPWLDERVHDPSWREVLVLLAGELDDPAPFLEQLANEEADDVFRPRLALAVLCLPELAPSLQTTEAIRECIDAITTSAMDTWIAWCERRIGRGAPALSESLASLPLVDGRWGAQRLLARVAEGLAQDGDAFDYAIFHVKWLGRAAATPPVVDALVARLDDASNHNVNSINATNALKVLGTAVQRPEVEAKLLRLLAHPEHVQRYNALDVIANARWQSPAFLEPMYRLLDDPETFIRTHAIHTFTALGPEVVTDRLVKKLTRMAARRNKTKTLPRFVLAVSAREALDAIARAKSGPRVVEQEDPALMFVKLVAGLDQTTPEERTAAAEALHRFCRRLTQYENPPSDFQERVLRAARALGPDSVSTFIASLGRAWVDDDIMRRCAAVDAAGVFGLASGELLELLLDRLNDESLGVARSAAEALGNLGRAAAKKEVLDVLVEFLSSKRSDERGAVARAIGRMGPAAATPAILRALLRQIVEGGNDRARDSAQDALIRLGEAAATPETLAELVALLYDDDNEVRSSAAGVLGEFQRSGIRVPRAFLAQPRCKEAPKRTA